MVTNPRWQRRWRAAALAAALFVPASVSSLGWAQGWAEGWADGLDHGEFAAILSAARAEVPEGELIDVTLSEEADGEVFDLLFLEEGGQLISVRIDAGTATGSTGEGGEDLVWPTREQDNESDDPGGISPGRN